MVWSQRYDAFGQTVKQAGSFTNPLGYGGERYDATLGQYYLRARYYDPRQGRFTGMDPFAGNMGDPLQLNRYGYGGMNPIGMMDPSGNNFFVSISLGAFKVAGYSFGAAAILGVGGVIARSLGFQQLADILFFGANLFALIGFVALSAR